VPLHCCGGTRIVRQEMCQHVIGCANNWKGGQAHQSPSTGTGSVRRGCQPWAGALQPERESTSLIQCVLVTETTSPGIGAEESSAPAGVTCVTDRPRTNLVTRHLPDMVVARARHGAAKPSGATNSARQTQSVSRTECDRVTPCHTMARWRPGRVTTALVRIRPAGRPEEHLKEQHLRRMPGEAHWRKMSSPDKRPQATATGCAFDEFTQVLRRTSAGKWYVATADPIVARPVCIVTAQYPTRQWVAQRVALVVSPPTFATHRVARFS